LSGVVSLASLYHVYADGLMMVAIFLGFGVYEFLIPLFARSVGRLVNWLAGWLAIQTMDSWMDYTCLIDGFCFFYLFDIACGIVLVCWFVLF